MPTYEYACEKCGHQFEKFQSMSDRPLTMCPKELCAQKRWGKGKVRKLISSGAGLLFKGSGFYITDYRDGSYKESAKADSGGSEAKTEGKSESKSETKSESKSESKSETKPAAESKPAAKTESKPAAKNEKKK